MLSRVPIIISAIAGISATFLPWVVYPAANMKLHGFAGDGLITMFLFSLVLIAALLPLQLKYLKIANIFSLIVGLAVFSLCLYNLISIRKDQSNFVTDNFLTTLATTGFHEGSGLYLNMFAGLSCAVVSMSTLISLKREKGTTPKKAIINLKYAPYAIGVLLLIGTAFAFTPQMFNLGSQKIPKNIENIFKSDVNKMIRAFEVNDFQSYVKLVHPVLIQSMGGTKRLQEFFESTNRTFKEDKINIVSVEIEKVIDVKSRSKDIQAVFVQKVTFGQEGNEKVERQKTLAVKEIRSNNWRYLTLGDKNLDELKKIFPDLNTHLEI